MKRWRPTRQSGFTMVEIALCLAIIGFALVAIIGVLPTGLNVQKDNREETIVNQDAAVWMNAIRSGGKGYDDLTNYVIAITNYVWHYEWNPGSDQYELSSSVGRTGTPGPSPEVNVFTLTAWYRNGALQSGDPQFLLTNGMHIIGALCRPKVEWDPPQAGDPYGGFFRNYIVANVRSISGSVVDKFPQTNTVIVDGTLAYRLIPQIEAYLPFPTNLIRANQVGDYVPYDKNTPPGTIKAVYNPFNPALPDIVNTNTEPAALSDEERVAYWDQVRMNRRTLGLAHTNTHDLRLMFRWPLLPNGDTGNGRQTFRALVGGKPLRTNDPSPGVLGLPLYFFQSSTYAHTP